MDGRIIALEAAVSHIQTDVTELRTDMKDVRERIVRSETKIDGISERVAKLPTQWDMAKVVIYVMGALSAAAIFGPRLWAMIPH